MRAAFISVYGALLSIFLRGDSFHLACVAMRTKSFLAISHIWWLSNFPKPCFWHHTFQTLFLIHHPRMSNVRCYGTHSWHNVTSGSVPSCHEVEWAGTEGGRSMVRNNHDTKVARNKLSIRGWFSGLKPHKYILPHSNWIYQFPLSQILKVLMAFQMPSDARLRIHKVAVQRDKSCSQMWLKLFTFAKLTKTYG